MGVCHGHSQPCQESWNPKQRKSTRNRIADKHICHNSPARWKNPLTYVLSQSRRISICIPYLHQGHSQSDSELLRTAQWVWVIIIKHRNEFPGKGIWLELNARRTINGTEVVTACQKRFFKFYHLTVWKTHAVFFLAFYDRCSRQCCAELRKTSIAEENSVSTYFMREKWQQERWG